MLPFRTFSLLYASCSYPQQNRTPIDVFVRSAERRFGLGDRGLTVSKIVGLLFRHPGDETEGRFTIHRA